MLSPTLSIHKKITLAHLACLCFNLSNWFVLAGILLANSDEPNLILPKFARLVYCFFFSHQLFGTYRNKYC